jgi:hypothetical protein
LAALFLPRFPRPIIPNCVYFLSLQNVNLHSSRVLLHNPADQYHGAIDRHSGLPYILPLRRGRGLQSLPADDASVGIRTESKSA